MSFFDSQPIPSSSGRSLLQSEMSVAKENSGALSTFATLPAAANHLGDVAYTSDQGLCYSNGTAWVPIATAGGIAFTSAVADTPGTDQNDYAPTGWVGGVTNVLKLTPSANINITGILATGVPDGWIVAIDNNSTTFIVDFTDGDAGSAAANQMACPGQVTNTLGPRASTLIRRDATLGKWRFLS